MLGFGVRGHSGVRRGRDTTSGPRPFESVITALLLIIATGFVVGLGSGGWSTRGLVHGTVPHFDGADPIHGLYRALGAEHGAPVAALFAIALLASGLAASSVGTFAGQVVMDGFLRRSVPIVVRRVATMASAIVVLAVGANPTTALVASQVVLSFGLPFARVPLVWFSARRDLLGSWALSRRLTVVAVAATAVVIALNLALIVLSV
jgi:manganese transport protein